jgi:hypothetical protein
MKEKIVEISPPNGGLELVPSQSSITLPTKWAMCACVIFNDLKCIYSKNVSEKIKKTEGYIYPTLLFFIHFFKSLSLSNPLSLFSLCYFRRRRRPVRRRHRLLRRTSPENTPKPKLFTSNFIVFTCSIQIRNPKFKKAHQSTGSERQTAATKNSLLSRLCFGLRLLSSFVLLFLLSVWSTVLDLWMIEWNEKLVRLVLIWCMRMRVWSCELCSMRGIWVSEFLFLHPLLLVSASLFIEMMMNGIDHWIILWTG